MDFQNEYKAFQHIADIIEEAEFEDSKLHFFIDEAVDVTQFTWMKQTLETAPSEEVRMDLIDFFIDTGALSSRVKEILDIEDFFT